MTEQREKIFCQQCLADKLKVWIIKEGLYFECPKCNWSWGRVK